MKKILLLLIAVIFFQSADSQTPGEWVWLHGYNVPGNPGDFGTQQIPSVNNVPPALYEAIQWTDLNGNFWLYGGNDQSGNHQNALWKYDVLTNIWTWINGPSAPNDPGDFGTQGVPAFSNHPSGIGYGAATWVDLNNNLWFFGGSHGSQYADLWKYDIANDLWTWMKGPGTPFPTGIYGTMGVPNIANYPAGRSEVSATWVDNAGDLWLFGGSGVNGSFNDLWRFNIASNTWTWMKGKSTGFPLAVYGTKGTEYIAHVPGGRLAYCHWMDKKGNFWIFGGWGVDSRNQYGILNDLWRFNPVTNNWAWMGGADTIASPGRWGTPCVASNDNVPCSRYENRACWTDPDGNFWTFGGGYTNHFDSTWNDLWKYCVNSNQWIWINGDSTISPPGSWGTKGISSPTNVPNGRAGSPSWTDNNGNFYFFGGSTSLFPMEYNDMWRFTIDTTCAVCAVPVAQFTSSDTAFCNESGECIDFFDHSTGNPTTWQWTFPGAVPDTSSLQNPTNICYYVPGTYPVTLIVSNGGAADTLVVSPLIIFGQSPPPPTLTQANDTIFCSHAAAYQWYYNGSVIPGATDSFYVCGQPGVYAVMITDDIGCSRLSNGVSGCFTGINELEDVVAGIYPNPVQEALNISFISAGKNTIEIFNTLGEKVFAETISGQLLTVDCKFLASGIYFVRVSNNKLTDVVKFMKE